MRFWLLLFTFGSAAAWGCSPEVVIARDDTSAPAIAGEGGEGGASEPSMTSGAGGEELGGRGASGGAGAAAGGEGGSFEQPPSEPSRILADSVADFSLVQGERGWYYGYDLGFRDSMQLLPRTSVVTQYVPVSGDTWGCWTTEDEHWTQIFQLGAHPNGTDTSAPSTAVLERAVRRWISNYSGDIRIVGELAKIDVTPGGSNGVFASIWVDGIEVYSVVIGGEDAGGLSYEAVGNVEINSTVDFILDPHEGADHHDLTRFTAVIERAISQSG
jgi:hypothetical protein